MNITITDIFSLFDFLTIKIIKTMEKKEALEKTLGMDYTQLVPSTTMKSELFLLTNDEFEQLRKYINISDYQMSENDYDTIIICNRIFKKSNQLNIYIWCYKIGLWFIWKYERLW